MEPSTVGRSICLPQGRTMERFLSPAEMERLFAVLDDLVANHSRARVGALCIKFLACSGMRKSEAVGLRWADVDLDGRFVHLDRYKGSERGRYVPLGAEAVAVLHEAAGHPLFVFPNRRGAGPIRDVRHVWKRALGGAGLSGVRIHDLRHSFGSQLVNAGASLYAVQRLMGHKNAATTQRYSHLADETLHAAADTFRVIRGGRDE